MVQIGVLARRGAQRDAGHRARVATLSRTPIWITEGRFFQLSDRVVSRLWSLRPRRETRLVRKLEKPVKVVPIYQKVL